MIRVERTPEEVFRPESIASAQGKPATIDHPDEDVTPANWRDLAVGYGINPHRGENANDELLLADLMITCPAAIDAVRAHRLKEISLGYDADYEEIEPGRGRQSNIVINHIALLEPGAGRCGPICSIRDRRSTTDALYTYHSGGFVVGRGQHATAKEALAYARQKYGQRVYVMNVGTGEETRDATLDATIRVGIKETSPNVWRVTRNGNVLGDSRGYSRREAEAQARSIASRTDEGHWEGSTWIPDKFVLDLPTRDSRAAPRRRPVHFHVHV